MGNEWQGWYDNLNKPVWTPDGGTISLIWTILYPIIFITYGIVFYKIYKKKIPKKFIWPFLINLGANFLFTPIFFGLKNLPLSTVDILVVWVTIILTIKILWKKEKTLALLQLPYLIWVSIATYLQISITLFNL